MVEIELTWYLLPHGIMTWKIISSIFTLTIILWSSLSKDIIIISTTLVVDNKGLDNSLMMGGMRELGYLHFEGMHWNEDIEKEDG